VTAPQPLAVLLPALLCPAVEDITGHPCRRLQCDGAHAWDGRRPPLAPETSPPARTDLKESA
jgi:hypothetical protein